MYLTTNPPRGIAAPIYDHAAGIVRVPLSGRTGFAVLDIEDFEVLSQRRDLLMSPMRLGRHHGEQAVRVKYREQPQDGVTVTQAVSDFILRPPFGHRIAPKDGNPLNLRRCNLVAVPLVSQGVA